MDLSSWMGWVRFPGSWASMTHEGHQGLNCVVLVQSPSADVGVVEGVAGGVNVHCEGVCGLLLLPVVNHGVNCIDQAMLGNRVEEAHQVVVGEMSAGVWVR